MSLHHGLGNYALVLTRWTDRQAHPLYIRSIYSHEAYKQAGIDLFVAYHGKEPLSQLEKNSGADFFCVDNGNHFDYAGLFYRSLQLVVGQPYRAVGILDDDAAFNDLPDLRKQLDGALDYGLTAFGPCGNYRYVHMFKQPANRIIPQSQPIYTLGSQWWQLPWLESKLSAYQDAFSTMLTAPDILLYCLAYNDGEVGYFHTKYQHQNSAGTTDGQISHESYLRDTIKKRVSRHVTKICLCELKSIKSATALGWIQQRDKEWFGHTRAKYPQGFKSIAEEDAYVRSILKPAPVFRGRPL